MKAKKILASLLASSLVLSSAAMVAFAEGEVTTAADLQTALNEGGTVTLGSDITVDSTVNITNDVTIDLNGHNITATDARALFIKSGNVTIIGSGTIETQATEGTSFATSSSVIRVGDSAANGTAAKLTIGSGVTVSSAYCYGVAVFGKNTAGIEAVIDGTVSVTGVQAAVSGNGNSGLSATTMTINGTVSATQDYAIYHPGSGTLTVNSGAEITGEGGIEAKGGTVTINGGTIGATAVTAVHEKINNNGTSTSGYALAAVNNKNYVGNAKFVVNNGTINGAVDIINDYNDPLTASISISGGTFSSDVQPYVANGYSETVGNDTYTVAKTSNMSNIEDGTVKTAVVNNKYDQMTVKTETVSGSKIIYTIKNSNGTERTKVAEYGTISGNILYGLIVTGVPAGETITITSVVE